MKIFITGATGYIGSELAHQLAQSGHTVHALVRSACSSKFMTHPNIKIFVGDILDMQSISFAIRGCRQVYHTAGLVRICARDRSKFYLHNVTGTENVLKSALSHNVERLVYTSSCGVWGVTGNHVFTENDPRIAAFDNDYEVSKLMAEKAVLDYCSRGLDCVIVNPTKVFGFGTYHRLDQTNYNTYLSDWLRKRVILLPWKLKVISNMVFLRDVIEGHILAMERGQIGEKYILGGENISLDNVLATINGLSGKRKYVVRLPYFIILIWALYEVLKSNIQRCDPLIVPSTVRRLSQHTQYSSQRASEQLGYRITPFADALKQTIKDAKRFYL